ncbi:MAG TPA: 30S ribosomal protein S1 [Gaiellaceae bacterium]|nr:30S ribosomal protein S1 [Gaiellaceae bacterium]
MVSNDTTTEADIEQADDGVWTRGPDGELIPDYDSTFPVINEGEVVRGKVVRVDKDEVLVDIGYKSEGVIPVSELSIRRSVNPADEVNLGDEIDALVMTKEDAEGRLILSKKRARFEMAWKRIEGAAESGEPVEGTVIEVVKGGLILDLGVRGFLPASLVDIRRVQDLDEFMSQTLRCKVIELNRSRNNVVLSRRAVLEEERREMRQAILDRLSPGDIVTGTISNIVDFGAFVDLEGIDGLIHISELSWSHVNHPSELLEIGQEVKVKVLDIDRDRQRISLGLKQTQTDPWQQVIDTYEQGDVVEGRVTKVVTFGAFVEVIPGVEGLVHISELATHHVENPREVVQQGETLRAKIIEMDAERRRLSLSLKRVEEGEAVRPGLGGEPPDLGLSEEVFVEGEAVEPDVVEAEAEVEAVEAEAAAPAVETEALAEVEQVEETVEPAVEAEVEQVDETTEPAVEAEVEQVEETVEPAAEAEVEPVDETAEPAVAAEGLSEDEAAPEGEAPVEPGDEQP